ncbi:hypothetical protein [Streptomyces sp. CBMA152]|uniref:hypothetical protein n=1 Tax=Streptomyces sp. CBMA152 TaxID=1896312 RepID=UPI001660B616|nr:hypothetical protein [Streptomyces sp. CBMA152]MBD0743542.1 hypothetical protein [Streptomyces sp. CBMA152]
MTKTVRVQPHVLDQCLRDPFEEMTYLPKDMIRNAPLSVGAIGLLTELIVSDDWDIENARAAEQERRAAGNPPEDIDELVAELETAGYVTVAVR